MLRPDPATYMSDCAGIRWKYVLSSPIHFYHKGLARTGYKVYPGAGTNARCALSAGHAWSAAGPSSLGRHAFEDMLTWRSNDVPPVGRNGAPNRSGVRKEAFPTAFALTQSVSADSDQAARIGRARVMPWLIGTENGIVRGRDCRRDCLASGASPTDSLILRAICAMRDLFRPANSAANRRRSQRGY